MSNNIYEDFFKKCFYKTPDGIILIIRTHNELRSVVDILDKAHFTWSSGDKMDSWLSRGYMSEAILEERCLAMFLYRGYSVLKNYLNDDIENINNMYPDRMVLFHEDIINIKGNDIVQF